MFDFKNFKIEIDRDPEIWSDYAYRFIGGLYSRFKWLVDIDDKDKLIEILMSIVGFIDGLGPDARAYVQPSLGFVINPMVPSEEGCTVVLPLFATSSATELVAGIVNVLYGQAPFGDIDYAMLSDEQLIELKQLIRKNYLRICGEI